MTDIALRWDEHARRFDLVLDADGEGAPVAGPDLETEVIARLWSWRRAEVSDALPDGGDGDRQGWWGDGYRTDGADLTGCRWWLLARRVITDEVIAEAKAYLHEALAGLVADGIAASVRIDLFRAGVTTVGGIVTIDRPDGSAWSRRFDDLWADLGTPT